eukprot:gene6652-6380_t
MDWDHKRSKVGEDSYILACVESDTECVSCTCKTNNFEAYLNTLDTEKQKSMAAEFHKELESGRKAQEENAIKEQNLLEAAQQKALQQFIKKRRYLLDQADAKRQRQEELNVGQAAAVEQHKVNLIAYVLKTPTKYPMDMIFPINMNCLIAVEAKNQLDIDYGRRNGEDGRGDTECVQMLVPEDNIIKGLKYLFGSITHSYDPSQSPIKLTLTTYKSLDNQ